MKNICATCYTIDYEHPVLASVHKRPLWLQEQDFVQEFVSKTTDFRIRKAPSYNQKITLTLGKQHAGQKILYWAANPKSTPESNLKIQDARQAYGDFTNHGVASINGDGIAIVYLQCPQPYKTTMNRKTKAEPFYRHLHFVYSDSQKKAWKFKLYTQVMICELTKKQTADRLSSGYSVVLNTLPAEYYAKEHIPNSYNLHYETIKSMSVKQLEQWMKDVIERNYPKLWKQVKKGAIGLAEVPIVSYCAHSKCNASHLATYELMKKGFVNVEIYPGGMKDWEKH